MQVGDGAAVGTGPARTRGGVSASPGGAGRPGRAAGPPAGSRSARGAGAWPAGTGFSSTQTPAGAASSTDGMASQSASARAARCSCRCKRRRTVSRAWPAHCTRLWLWGRLETAGRPRPANRQQAASAAEQTAWTQRANSMETASFPAESEWNPTENAKGAVFREGLAAAGRARAARGRMQGRRGTGLVSRAGRRPGKGRPAAGKGCALHRLPAGKAGQYVPEVVCGLHRVTACGRLWTQPPLVPALRGGFPPVHLEYSLPPGAISVKSCRRRAKSFRPFLPQCRRPCYAESRTLLFWRGLSCRLSWCEG